MDELTEQLPPRHTKLDGLRVLEANAMIVHLVVHMDGHRDGMGYLLSWLNDLAFVIATWGDRLDVDRIEALMPDEASMRTLLRVMRFYRDDFGIEPPEQFRARVDAAGEMTLASVLRERTRVQWGLPTARGWARLLACRVAGRDRKGRMYPSVGDLLAMPGDLARERKG